MACRFISVPLIEEEWLLDSYLLCAPTGEAELLLDLYIYILCAPNEEEEWLLDLYLLCAPNGEDE